MTWHADHDLLAGYTNGRLGRAQASSVEAHLMACAECRAALGPMIDAERLDRNLAAVVAAVDQPVRRWPERFLVRCGVGDRLARLMAVVPGARDPWLAALALVLGLAMLWSTSEAGDRTTYLFLVAAALVPVGAVAAVFATGGDAARELVATTPAAGLELLLSRWAAVVVPASLVAAVFAVAVPGIGWAAMAWLLPSVCMAAVTIALASWLPVRTVALTVAGLWIAGAAWSARGRTDPVLIDRFVAFRPAGQAVLAVVSGVAGIVLVLRRERFEVGPP